MYKALVSKHTFWHFIRFTLVLSHFMGMNAGVKPPAHVTQIPLGVEDLFLPGVILNK
jgi:hypothetical protein